MREATTLVLQQLIELEAEPAIGAGRYERTDARTTNRHGSRSRLLSTPRLVGAGAPAAFDVLYLPGVLRRRSRAPEHPIFIPSD